MSACSISKKRPKRTRAGARPAQRGARLIARWIAATPDGDISGAGFPAFLAAIVSMREITDRRGECIYAACPHYRTCFIERAIRRSRHAQIVVANHALVIAQATRTGWPPTRRRTSRPSGACAMCSTKAIICSMPRIPDSRRICRAREMAELRRWIAAPKGRVRSRMRGLEERLKDLVADDDAAQSESRNAMRQARRAGGRRLDGAHRGGGPRGPGEIFSAEAYQHVRARSEDRDAFYSLEADTEPLGDETIAAARALASAEAHRRAAFASCESLRKMARQIRRARKPAARASRRRRAGSSGAPS
jgi:ATP-dependent DNA helicase DinG